MKKYRNNTPMPKSDAKFEEKLALGSKNDMSDLVNFIASSGKSENFFWLIFLIYGVQNPRKWIESTHWIYVVLSLLSLATMIIWH